MKNVFFLLLLLAIGSYTFCQQASYFDAAQTYNRLVIERNSGAYTRVGNYKVIGSPYLFGEKHKGNLFAKGEIAYNIFLSYNAYTQEVEFYSTANPDKALVKEAELVDSFELKSNTDLEMEDMRFVYGAYAGSDEKEFFQIIYRGPNYSLFKKYKPSLEVVSTNYVQSELRQFSITPKYFYRSASAGSLKPLKISAAAILKEFKKVKDLSATFDAEDLMIRRENTLRKIFEVLNN